MEFFYYTVPIMVSRDGFTANIKHENHVDDHDLRTMCTRSRHHGYASARC